MPLRTLPLSLDEELDLPSAVSAWLELCREYIQGFWDRRPELPPVEFVECDYEWVARGVLHCAQRRAPTSVRFLEWGCGLGCIAGVADLLGMQAVGIEAEEFLFNAADTLHRRRSSNVSIWHGNFLPDGAQELSTPDDPVVALKSNLPSAYASLQSRMSDFDLIYVYAWPGEEHFLKLVFDRFARIGCLFLLYRGPYQLELYEKIA